MPEGKKTIYRLFKVAKELNVGSHTLVEHLQEKGFDVTNSPNAKLNGEMYGLLLKEYSSEKVIKQKAEQFIEKRKEEARVTQVRTHTGPGEEEPEKDPMSAEQLRNTLSPRSKAVPEEPQEKSVQVPADAKKEEKPSVGVEPVKSDSDKPVEKPVADQPKLTVLGKIDLNSIGKKPEMKTPEKPIEKEEQKVEAPKTEATKVEAPKIEVPKVEAPKVESKEETTKEEPKVEAPKTVEQTEKPPVEKVAPRKVVAREEPASREEEKEEEQKPKPKTLMRAGDRTPELSGLKVLGKIDLGGPKKSKLTIKSDPKKTGTTDGGSGTTEGEEDEAGKKRRRRRRKRNRKTSVKTGVEGGTDASKDKKVTGRKAKKEKPTEKEVDDSIRNTLSAMSQGASRSRQRLRRARRDAEAEKREREIEQAELDSRILDVTEFITANEFANLMDVPVNDIITKSFQLGMMVSINQRLDAELISIIGEEYGFEVNFVDATDQDFEIPEDDDAPEELTERAPIITVMGHVDHGKTTLLDYLRKTNVTAGEAGGITQHIGAYEVQLKSGKHVTFLDTPGHEAFTAMRARGAKATDVVIVVIAADDAVMPQTREAINHAQAAHVPMVFAINKMDKAGADPERIKGQLSEMNILVEDWGGKFQSQEISALKGVGVDDLLEKVILESDMLELKANPDKNASGTVIESRLDKGRGNVVTLLVQNGTLSVGDSMLAGIHFGKVRALINQNGERIEHAGPAVPVQVLGLNGQPQAGDKFQIFEDESAAKSISQKRSELFREQQFRQTRRITLDEIGRRRAIGNFKELNVIIKGDVDGSVEALAGALLKLSTDEVQVNILMKSVGAITEGDVLLASASDAVIIAFNVRPNAQARSLAEREEIDVRTYSVIYDAINDVRDALEGLLSPEIKEEIMGTAEVRDVFKITKVGNVAGAYVTSGKIYRNDRVRVIRENVVIYDSSLSSLKRFKDDVKEVANGFEFGFMVDNYNDIKEGDVIESYRQKEVKRKL